MLAKSKLNNIETLMSQVMIGLEISHEEFKKIVDEKEKYDQMKEIIKNIKIKTMLVKTYRLKKIYIFSVYIIKWLLLLLIIMQMQE